MRGAEIRKIQMGDIDSHSDAILQKKKAKEATKRRKITEIFEYFKSIFESAHAIYDEEATVFKKIGENIDPKKCNAIYYGLLACEATQAEITLKLKQMLTDPQLMGSNFFTPQNATKLAELFVQLIFDQNPSIQGERIRNR